MSSSSSSDWRHWISYLGPDHEIDEELLTATLTYSQETPIVILFCSFHIRNFHESSSSFDEQVFGVEGDSDSEHWDAILDLRCFSHTLSIAELSIRDMMTQTSFWVRVPLDIRETMITQIASNLMAEYRINEGSNTALGNTSIPCFQLHVKLALIVEEEEELNFRRAAQQSFDAAQRDDVVLQCHPVFATLLESLVTEVVGTMEDDKEECVICKDEFFTGVEVKGLPCSHHFHEQCIIRWFQEKNTCPLCRHIIQV